MSNQTFLLLTSMVEEGKPLPTDARSYRYVPVSCEDSELGTAVQVVNTEHGCTTIGFVNRAMINEMLGVMDKFEREST